MLGKKAILMILEVATVFFTVFYIFISLVIGQPVYLCPLVFGALIVSVAMGASVVFVYIYKENDKEIKQMGEWKFKKVEFLYELKLNLLLEIGLKDLYEEANIHYWGQMGNPQGEDILDMRWSVDSCNKEEQTITLKIVGYLEDNGE